VVCSTKHGLLITVALTTPLANDDDRWSLPEQDAVIDGDQSCGRNT
jgi:hypothetical protein